MPVVAQVALVAAVAPEAPIEDKIAEPAPAVTDMEAPPADRG